MRRLTAVHLHLPRRKFEKIHQYQIYIDWLRANIIYYEEVAFDMYTGYPDILLMYEEDAIIFKLKWAPCSNETI